MKCGIIGAPLSGKSTLFNILTGIVDVNTVNISRTETRYGIARVEDERLDSLARVSESKKIVPTTVEYIDIPGFEVKERHLEPFPPRHLSELGGVNMLALVLRQFSNPSVPAPSGSVDPKRDLEHAELDFLVNDLTIIERRLVKLSKSHEVGAKREIPLLERCRDTLSNDTPLRNLELRPEEEKILRGYSLLSMKPLLVVLNCGEDEASDPWDLVADLKKGFPDVGSKVGWVAAAAGIEAEIDALPEEDRGVFLAELGFKLPTLDRIIHRTYDLLGLITFFTTSEKDSHAWSIPAGWTAVEAAAVIHNDIARGFIRSEVYQWDELIELGSYSKLRDAGRLRLEGKGYVVKDGDVLHIRFNI
ncbi:MAG: redox-regulated ATPase YchF [Calditrichaeota bacterium]|nr:redox-regulated ATPase YchF [Calditrichota bacterium]